jgi:hypothetical protein
MFVPERIGFLTSFWLSIAWGEKENERGGTSVKVTVEGIVRSGSGDPVSLRSLSAVIEKRAQARFDHTLIAPATPDLLAFARTLAEEISPILEERGMELQSLTLEEEGSWGYRVEFPPFKTPGG